MYPFPAWTMPDGTRSFHRPKDGEKFTTSDGQVWMFDGLYEKWMRYSKVPLRDDDPAHPDFDQDMELARSVGLHFKPKECECGAEKVKSSKHSSWCAKYDPKQ